MVREHEFDVNGNVSTHRPTCWCSWWDEQVRAAKARQRRALAAQEPGDDSEDEPWWRK